MKNKQSSKGGQNKKNNRKNKKIQKSIWGTIIIALVIAAAFIYYSQPPDLLASVATQETIKKGEKIFNQNCVSCHGEKAVGENSAFKGGGEKINGGQWAPALNGTAHAWHHRDGELFKTIKNGSSNSGSPMRGFKDRLTDDEIAMVMHYFKDLWPTRIKVKRAQNPHH